MNRKEKELYNLVKSEILKKEPKAIIIDEKKKVSHLDFFDRGSHRNPFNHSSGKESGDYTFAFIDTSSLLNLIEYSKVTCTFTMPIGIFHNIKEENIEIYTKVSSEIKERILRLLPRSDRELLVGIHGEPPAAGSRLPHGEKYWYISLNNFVSSTTDTRFKTDNDNFDIGNYYFSEEEAKAALENKKSDIERTKYSSPHRVVSKTPYWFIDPYSKVVSKTNEDGSYIDNNRFVSGNYYASEYMAELALNEIKMNEKVSNAPVSNAPNLIDINGRPLGEKTTKYNPYNIEPIQYYIIEDGKITCKTNTGNYASRFDLKNRTWFRTYDEAKRHMTGK